MPKGASAPISTRRCDFTHTHTHTPQHWADQKIINCCTLLQKLQTFCCGKDSYRAVPLRNGLLHIQNTPPGEILVHQVYLHQVYSLLIIILCRYTWSNIFSCDLINSMSFPRRTATLKTAGSLEQSNATCLKNAAVVLVCPPCLSFLHHQRS